MDLVKNIKSIGNIFYKYIKILLVLGFIIFEEIAWNKVGKPIYHKVKSLKIMTKFKTWLNTLNNRYILLGIFIIPFVLSEIVALLSMKALVTGAITIGVILYITKLLLTIPVFIIFSEAKKELVSFWIVRYVYGLILRFKRWSLFKKVKVFIKELKHELVLFRNRVNNNKNGGLFEEFKLTYRHMKEFVKKQ